MSKNSNDEQSKPNAPKRLIEHTISSTNVIGFKDQRVSSANVLTGATGTEIATQPQAKKSEEKKE
jgi:hypothetical protein